MIPRIGAALASASVAVMLLGGCGRGPRQIDARGVTLLDAEIAAARDAASQGDYLKTATLLHAIDDSVNSLRRQDLVSDRRAASILSALGDVEDALRNYVDAHTTTTTATTTTTVVPAPAVPVRPHGGKPHGKGDGGGD